MGRHIPRNPAIVVENMTGAGSLIEETRTDEVGRRLATVVLASGELGRPYLLPRGAPAERVKILRGSFMKLMADPEFLAGVNSRNLEAKPSTGEQLEKLAREVIAQPPEVVGRVKKLMQK